MRAAQTRSCGARLQTPETSIEFSTLHANGISTPDTKSDNRLMHTSRSTAGGISMRSPSKGRLLTTSPTAARDSSPTVRSLRSQISAMHGQALAHSAQRSAGGTGPLAQTDPLVPSLKITNGKMVRRPPATADTHRADVSAPRMWSNMAATAPRASETWWCAEGAAGAESSGSKDGREPAHHLGFVGGPKPSSRSEAVVLSQSLQEQLTLTLTLTPNP